MKWQDINSTYVNPAKNLIWQGKHDEAEKLLLQGFHKTNDGWIAYHLGEVYLKSDNMTLALKYFDLAENLMPKPNFKRMAREGKAKAKSLTITKTKKEFFEPLDLSWNEINQTYVRPSLIISNPEEAIRLLKEGFQKINDGWLAFHIAERYKELGDSVQSKEYYMIAINNLPLPQYKKLAQKGLNELKTTIKPVMITMKYNTCIVCHESVQGGLRCQECNRKTCSKCFPELETR